MTTFLEALRGQSNAINDVTTNWTGGINENFNTSPPAGQYNGFRIVRAAGANPAAGSFPILLNVKNNNVTIGGNKLVLWGLRWDGVITFTVTDLVLFWCLGEYVLDRNTIQTVDPFNNSPDPYILSDTNNAKVVCCTARNMADGYQVGGSDGLQLLGSKTIDPYPSRNDDRWHSDAVDAVQLNKTTTGLVIAACLFDGRYAGSRTGHGHTFEPTSTHSLTVTYYDTWIRGCQGVSIDPGGGGTVDISFADTKTYLFDCVTNGVNPGATVHGTFSTSTPSGNDPTVAYRSAHPATLDTLLPFMGVATPGPSGPLIRESIIISPGDHGQLGGNKIPSLSTLFGKVSGDNFARKYRHDNREYPGGSYSGTILFQVLDAIMGKGANGVLIITDGPGGIPGSGIGTGYDASALHDSIANLTSKVRAHVGPSFWVALEGGNEINVTGDWTGAGGLSIPSYLRFYRNYYQGAKAGDAATLVAPGSTANAPTNKGDSTPGHNIYGYDPAGGKRLYSQLDLCLDFFFDGAWNGGEQTMAEVGADFWLVHPYPIRGSALFSTGNTPLCDRYTDINSLTRSTQLPSSGAGLAHREGHNGEPWRHGKWVAQAMYDAFIAAGKSTQYAIDHARYSIGEAAPAAPVARWAAGTRYPLHWVVYYNGGFWTATADHVSTSGAPPGAGGPWQSGVNSTSDPIYNGGADEWRFIELIDTTVSWWHAMIRQFIGYDRDVDGVYAALPNANNNADARDRRNLSFMFAPFGTIDSALLTSFKWGMLLFGSASNPAGRDGSGTYGMVAGGAEKAPNNVTQNPYRRWISYTTTQDPRYGGSAGPQPPDKVTGVTITKGDAEANIRWTIPPDNGSQIIDYEVSLVPAGGSAFIYRTENEFPGIIVPGLVNGVQYSCTVRARNSIDFGVWSTAVNFTLTGPIRREPLSYDFSTVPDMQSTTVSVGIGGGNATFGLEVTGGVGIARESDDEGTAFWPRGLNVKADEEIRSRWVAVDDPGHRSPGHFHRLFGPRSVQEGVLIVNRNTAFTADYILQVVLDGRGIGATGIGSFDMGGQAGASGFPTIWGVYPLNVKSQLKGSTLDVAVWLDGETEPAYNSLPGARTGRMQITDSRLPASGLNGWYIQDMPNGLSATITFDALALNAPSTGPTAPSVPLNVTASTSGVPASSARVSWGAPASNGGAPITNYDVRVYKSGVLLRTVPLGNVLTTVVGSLPDDNHYTFGVTARNSAGTSNESARSNEIVISTSQTGPPITGPTGQTGPPITGPPTTGVTGPSGPPVSIGTLLVDPPVATDDQLIFLGPGVAQRADAFVFTLLDSDGNYAGSLDVDGMQAPRIRVDTGGTIIRTLEGLSLPPSVRRDIDPLRDRLRAEVVLSNGHRFRLGKFMFGQQKRLVRSWGRTVQPDMFDETFVVDQPMGRTVSLAAGGDPQQLFLDLAAEVGITDVVLEVADVTIGEPISWNASTSRYEIMTHLAKLMGCPVPFFGNDERLHARAAPHPGDAAQHVYGPGTIIIDDSLIETDDSYRAPNRYIVTSGGSDAEITGVFDVPSSAPHSAATRGFVVGETFSVQGLTTTEAAELVALAEYLADARTYQQVSFTTTLNPHHDVYDSVSYGDAFYIETGWTATLTPGGAHEHELTRLW